ncbi:MAG: transporter substrate-binding domain-containing protein [Desulfobacteraceae bacterium]|nr:transporter substrate-binding domain-containing protein [Desulfobacteraceae bacterium]
MEHDGVGTRIIKEAFELVDINIEYKFHPWKRCVKMIEKGKIDGTFLSARSPEREKFADYSDVILTGGVALFHLKGNEFEWQSFNDLKGKKIGGVLGSDYGEKCKNAEDSGIINLHRVKKEKMLITMLLKDRLQLILLEVENGYDNIHSNFKSEASKISHNPKLASGYTLHLIVPKTNKKNLIDKFNKGLNLLKESGKYDQYIEESRQGQYKKN